MEATQPSGPKCTSIHSHKSKGMACTPGDPKCGRFFFIFLDFGQISPSHFWPAVASQGGGRGGGGQPTQPRLGTPPVPHVLGLPFQRLFLPLKPCREGNFYRKKPCTCTGFQDPKNRVRTRVFSEKTVNVHGFRHEVIVLHVCNVFPMKAVILLTILTCLSWSQATDVTHHWVESPC